MTKRYSVEHLTCKTTSTKHESMDDYTADQQTKKMTEEVEELRKADMHSAADLIEAKNVASGELSEEMKDTFKKIEVFERMGWQSSADELRKSLPIGDEEIDAAILVSQE